MAKKTYLDKEGLLYYNEKLKNILNAIFTMYEDELQKLTDNTVEYLDMAQKYINDKRKGE